MTDAEAHAAATIASPPVSPVYNISSQKPNDTLAGDADSSDMMASLDAALLRKASATNEVSSDYYSSSAGGGSENGQDDDSDISAHLGTTSHHDQNSGEHAPDQEGADPSLEQMGVDSVSEMDLRMLLQHAYEVIQEKERDLGMAAVLGQDLVETNDALQAKYQHLLTQLRHQRMHRPRQLTPPRKILLSPAPEMSGSIAIGGEDDANSDNENWVDFEPSRSSLHPSSASSHQHAPYRRSTNHSSMMRSRSRQDIEKLASLEDMNSDLLAKVDAITKELKQGRRQAFKGHRKAEQELKTVKYELDRTTTKVVDLEEQNGRLIDASRMIRQRRIMLKNQLPAPGSIPGSTMASMALEMQDMDDITIQEMLAEDSRIFEELRDRLQSLERKNTSLMQQKGETDKRTQQLVQELTKMQKDHEELLTNLCGFSDLQSAYEEQTSHVRELEDSMEELQNQISMMSSRLSQMNSPMLSPIEPSSPMQSVWRRDDADVKALKTILHGSTPQSMPLQSPGLKGQRRPRRTLLAELESEWHRSMSFFDPPRLPEPQQTIHLPGIHVPKSPRGVLKDHRHESESDTFSDDAGGRVKGWRERIQDMDEESVCESSSCIRKRGNRFRYAGSDTDGHTHAEDSDVERYNLRTRKRLPAGSGCDDDEDDDEMLSDCSDRHRLNYRRPSTPGCCCHMYDDYSGYSSYDDEEEDIVEGWAHFEDYDASSFGYDKKRDGYYLGRRSRRGVFGMFGLVQSMFLFFRLLWRWCRFIGILSTALGIAIYRGPDALLTDR
ncbi:hypothetical protein EDD21DRAFT_392563 [Dissophora ornata]|nr:hypothetical protein BGZ58_003113 [Dissophora ornata]KAI8594919.1 hypothetical protein EDD21DRAFT_392563 [Dissophora ornata]